MARVLLLSRVVPALMLIQGIGAFIHCLPNSMPAQAGIMKSLLSDGGPRLRQTPVKLRMPESQSCRMAAIGEEEAIKSIKAWDGTPKDSRLICSPSQSDAGVIASLLKEASTGSGDALLITPNCNSAKDFADMGRMAEYLSSLCPWAEVKAVQGAPQPCLSFKSDASKAGGASSKGKVDKEEVMGKVLDWFTQMLINMDDEEMYVAIGRSLLSVQHYAVSHATTSSAVAEDFWKEASSMVEGRQDGNIIMVMTDFMGSNEKEFTDFVESKFSAPMAWAAASSKPLVVTYYHPRAKSVQASPWPLVQISVFDPAPPRNPGDLGPDDEGDYLDAEMETASVTRDQLREAKAMKDAQMPESIPGFPLNLDELQDK